MTYPILWYSNAPWAGTGYGQQTALFAPRLKAAGHDIAIANNWGLYGAPIQWGGITVLPCGKTAYSDDILPDHASYHLGDRKGLVLGLFDAWVHPGEVWGSFNSAVWMPIDTDRVGILDRVFIQACKPNEPSIIAMSKHGKRVLNDIGVDAYYVPHGIDANVFTPDGPDLREQFSIPGDAFVVGINSANKGTPSRKAFAQQFDAFARLARNHKDVILALHTSAESPDGEDLKAILAALEVPAKRVRWTHQYAYGIGILEPGYVASFYRTCNVVSNASLGEGFGLATIEAQACGVPVVTTRAAASTELTCNGKAVEGTRFWNNTHKAFWVLPSAKELFRAYTAAYNGDFGGTRDSGIEFARAYDVDTVLCDYLMPALNSIGKTLN